MASGVDGVSTTALVTVVGCVCTCGMVISCHHKLMRDNYAAICRACQQSGRFDEPILFDGTFGDTDMGMVQKEVNAW